MFRFFILGSVISVISLAAFAAVESVSIGDAKTLREKLTGQKQIQTSKKNSKVSMQTIPLKSSVKAPLKKVGTLQNKPAQKSAQTTSLRPSQKGLALAREAKNEKNYILAIKRYNFILKHFSRTSEAKAALLDKAQIYKEMGLDEQATYNKMRASKQVTASIQSGLKIKK
jgi:hypothetical protein